MTSAYPGPRRDVSFEGVRAALDVILAAAANLRDYRDRLTSDDHFATVRDIEQAAEQIARKLELERGPAPAAATGLKRRGR